MSEIKLVDVISDLLALYGRGSGISSRASSCEARSAEVYIVNNQCDWPSTEGEKEYRAARDDLRLFWETLREAGIKRRPPTQPYPWSNAPLGYNFVYDDTGGEATAKLLQIVKERKAAAILAEALSAAQQVLGCSEGVLRGKVSAALALRVEPIGTSLEATGVSRGPGG